MFNSSAKGAQLHGFVHASTKAYAGVVYICFLYSDSTVSTSLFMAMSKVAPLKPLTIPRLELCAVRILALLLHSVTQDFNIPQENIFAWTDSSIVLSWLNTAQDKLKIYVAHRVQQILDKLPSSHWRHVRTNQNPADVVSRGTTALEPSLVVWT